MYETTDPRHDNSASAPKEPDLHRMAMETLNHLEQAHQEAARLDGHLFGNNEAKDNPPSPETVQGVIARSSELAAMLVSRLGTINRRAGTRPPDALQGLGAAQERRR